MWLLDLSKKSCEMAPKPIRQFPQTVAFPFLKSIYIVYSDNLPLKFIVMFERNGP